jgi:hypothetical protein
LSAWSIPRLWEGATVAVLASGPSMSAVVTERVRASGVQAIAVNNTFQLALWADMLYAADAGWWQFHEKDVASFAGLKVGCESAPGVLTLRNAGKVGYNDARDCVHTFGNSGAQAIQIAAKAGAKRILLCGFDMRGTHWHGSHPTPLRNSPQELMARWCEQMATLATELDRRDVEVLNCTPGSALLCFPMVRLEDVL